MKLKRVAEILNFWFVETPKTNWYNSTPEFDAIIRSRFLEDYETAASGVLKDWVNEAESGLALMILLDQFARNMFRGDAKSFAADPLARKYATTMIDRDLDQLIAVDRREFVFMPFMHSESLSDQERALDLFSNRMGTNAYNVLHARVHKEIIERFGRFPYRNEVLGRESTPEEISFLSDGGYAAIVKELKD